MPLLRFLEFIFFFFVYISSRNFLLLFLAMESPSCRVRGGPQAIQHSRRKESRVHKVSRSFEKDLHWFQCHCSREGFGYGAGFCRECTCSWKVRRWWICVTILPWTDWYRCISCQSNWMGIGIVQLSNKCSVLSVLDGYHFYIELCTSGELLLCNS